MTTEQRIFNIIHKLDEDIEFDSINFHESILDNGLYLLKVVWFDLDEFKSHIEFYHLYKSNYKQIFELNPDEFLVERVLEQPHGFNLKSYCWKWDFNLLEPILVEY